MSTQSAIARTPAACTRAETWFKPPVDILEKPDELVILAEMAGVKAEDIDLQFEKGRLTLHAKVAPRQDAGMKYLLREYDVGDYHRVFEVGETIDGARIGAEYKDGVLTVHLPKSQAANPRKIPIA